MEIKVIKPEEDKRKTLTIDPCEAGMIFLIQVEPLYALTFLEFDRIIANDDFPFAAVGRDKGGKLGLYYNQVELSKWNRIQIGYVFAHELLHVILMHFDRHPEHSELWNIAEDLAINDMLRDDSMVKLFGQKCELPGCFPGEGKFIDLPRGLNANEYYELLLKNGYKAKKKTKWVVTVTNGKGESVDVTITSTQKLSKEDKKQVEQVLKEAIKKAATYGRTSEKMKELIQDFLKDRLNWPAILAGTIGTIRSTRARNIFAFSRKYDDQVGTRRTRKLNIVAIMDTSGSVPIQALRRFGGVLENLARIGGCVYVMECDAEIGNEYYLKNKWKECKVSKKITGRGGTSFIPPFQNIKKKKMEPDVVVYMTDLEGPFPEGKDRFPNTIWVTVCDHPVPFGRKIVIPEGQSED